MTDTPKAHRGLCPGRSRVRWLAAISVSLLVAGCGTRLDDAQIEAAAGMGAAAALMAGPGDVNAGGGAEVLADADPVAEGPGATDVTDPGETGPSAVAGVAGPSAGPRPARESAGASRPAGSGAAPSQAAPAADTAAGPSAAPAPATPATAAPTQPAPGEASLRAPIVLGHIGDYSGLIGTLMKGGNVMAQVVARYLNDQGGLNDHPIQVISGDAGGDPARALSLVRDMVENKGAVAFVGTLMVFSGYGPRDYLEQRRIPVIGGDGTTNVWLQSPMYFTSAANFPGISLGALTGLVNEGKKRIALFHCVEAEQCKTWHDTATANAQRLGAEIVYQAQVSLAQPDFTAECIQAQRSGADAAMTGLDGPSIVRFARSCAQQGYRPQIMTASLAVIDSIAKDPNLDGLTAPQGVFPHIADDTPAAQEYQAAIARYAPTLERSPAVAQVWTAGMLLREVGRALPPGPVTSADFFPGLYAIKENTLGGLVGPLTFNEGSTADEVRCVFFIRVAGGNWTAPGGSEQHCF